ncbi:MAG: hypothetical protein E7031_02055 [Akkermansiaceae bacterium]|nr:hypothetical protein [Akkermansiaceae bacterium]
MILHRQQTAKRAFFALFTIEARKPSPLLEKPRKNSGGVLVAFLYAFLGVFSLIFTELRQNKSGLRFNVSRLI